MPGYDIPFRALFYCCRMVLSLTKEVESEVVNMCTYATTTEPTRKEKSLKTLVLFMSITIAFLLCACGSEKETAMKSTDNTPAVSTDTSKEPSSATQSDASPVIDHSDEAVSDNDTVDTDEPTTESVTPKYISITVDDGPDGVGCDEYLRICEEQDIKITFFVIGQNIEKNGKQLRSMVESGCEVGNHSWSHTDLTSMSDEEVLEEISMTTEKILEYCPEAKVTFVRAPFFAYSDTVNDLIKYPFIDAALAESDSDNSDKTLETILSADDGDIILLHCWNEGSIHALETAIPEMKEAGFQFVTVSELFDIKGVEPLPGLVYRHISENLTGMYTPTQEIFTDGEFTDGDWSNWKDAAVLNVADIKNMTEDQALMVRYESTANPCLILQSWSGGEGWVQVTPSSDDGSTAIFTYEDLLEQFKADSFSRLNACMIRPFGSSLTVRSVCIADKT